MERRYVPFNLSEFMFSHFSRVDFGGDLFEQWPVGTPVSVEQNAPAMEADGVLPTVPFQRIFISGSDRYVIFDPK